MDDAQLEQLAALANIFESGRPAFYQRIKEQFEIREAQLARFESALSVTPAMNYSKLETVEMGLTEALQQNDWQMDIFASRNEEDLLLVKMFNQYVEMKRLLSVVEAMLADSRVPRKSGGTPYRIASKKELESVDWLIGIMTDAKVMSDTETNEKYKQFSAETSKKMIEEGINFGQAAGFPDFFEQPEAEFKSMIKDRNQDLVFQSKTTVDFFVRYLKTGDTVPPHYPLRIAVILRKLHDFPREHNFLTAWTRHFPYGFDAGQGYGKLYHRARRVGVQFERKVVKLDWARDTTHNRYIELTQAQKTAFAAKLLEPHKPQPPTSIISKFFNFLKGS